MYILSSNSTCHFVMCVFDCYYIINVNVERYVFVNKINIKIFSFCYNVRFGINAQVACLIQQS